MYIVKTIGEYYKFKLTNFNNILFVTPILNDLELETSSRDCLRQRNNKTYIEPCQTSIENNLESNLFFLTVIAVSNNDTVYMFFGRPLLFCCRLILHLLGKLHYQQVLSILDNIAIKGDTHLLITVDSLDWMVAIIVNYV